MEWYISRLYGLGFRLRQTRATYLTSNQQADKTADQQSSLEPIGTNRQTDQLHSVV